MSMMLDDFELDYRKREIQRYQDRLDEGKLSIEVPTQAVIKMLAENLTYRARIDYLIEQILRHNFNIPQRIVMPSAAMEPGNNIK